MTNPEETTEATVRCGWTDIDGEGVYDTGCGKVFTVTEGSPQDNEMRFCPFCGRILDADPIRGEGKILRDHIEYIEDIADMLAKGTLSLGDGHPLPHMAAALWDAIDFLNEHAKSEAPR